jgi:hypothetical protein
MIILGGKQSVSQPAWSYAVNDKSELKNQVLWLAQFSLLKFEGASATHLNCGHFSHGRHFIWLTVGVSCKYVSY